MKKTLILLSIVLLSWQVQANATDLIEVYQQALISDPTFQQKIVQSLVTKENVPISIAAILPALSLTANPTVTKLGYSGTSYQISSFNNIFAPRNLTETTYTLSLNLTQPVFNVSLFEDIAIQLANAKSAEADLNAALQDLITRVASAYFAILKDEDNLSYAAASRRNYAQQLSQNREQYKVGLKTLTDVYTAEASYATADANYIAAQTTLKNDRENLQAITGVYYEHLAILRKDFPLISPKPEDVNAWVRTAIEQNWSIKSSQYKLESARQNIYKQNAGHLPTVDIVGTAARIYDKNIDRYRAFTDRNGPGTTSDRAIGLNINVPIFSGGGVIAKTQQAVFNFEAQDRELEKTIRSTVNTTRQTYNNLLSGISQIKADIQAVKSAQSSYEGFEASYRVGTETLVDVLNQQAKVYQAQTTYATDRYAFVNNIFLIKQAAGILAIDDVRAINGWLVDEEQPERKLMGEG